ncbi:hypothetical protein [uncultured Bradyrhizobium sp.]|uniref:hypothetical protein n=1 Tax=uncultured Bradyrhizobium sp. TaxID=199684 RepID=UPI0035C9DAE3
MFRNMLSAVLATALAASMLDTGKAVAADRSVAGLHSGQRGARQVIIRRALPGLPRAHYSYRTTVIAGPPVPYDARPIAYGRYPYAPYTNSYGIPAAVIVDPVDPALLWRPLPYDDVYATPYSCFYYGSC